MKERSVKCLKRSRKIALLAGAFFAAASLAGGTTSAATSSLIVSPGTLSVTCPAIADFGAVVLDGNDHTTNAPMGRFTVTDARGTGAGWNVTVQATQFTAAGKTLASGSISMPAPSVFKADVTSGAAPAVNPGPYPIDSPSAITVASAATDTGMGSYTFAPGELMLTVAATSYAGTYTSTVTVSVIAGP